MMPQLTATALRAVRLRFGDDADNVLALREAGKTVRPYGDQFSVDEVVMDSDGLQRLADQLRAREEAKARRAAARKAPARRTKSPAGSESPSAGEGVVETRTRGRGQRGALADLVEKAGKRFAALTPEQQEVELTAQKASFVRGQIGMGSDADEAEYRRRMRAGETLHDTPSGAPPTADAPNKFARLADMVASRAPAPVREPTNAERDADIAALKRQVAELRERLDQFTAEGR